MPTNVSGSIKTLATGASGSSTNAFIRFVLRGTRGAQPTVTGTGTIAPLISADGQFYCDIPADSSGNVTGTIYSTRDATGLLGGDISVSGSTTAVSYGMIVYANGTAGPEIAIHAKQSATIDVASPPAISLPVVVTAPTGDTTYLRTDAANSPVTGLTTFSAGLLTKKLNLVRFADQYSGSDAGAKIAAAIADLPSGGVVDCRGFGAGTQTVSSTITLGGSSTPILLLCDPSTKFQPGSAALDMFSVNVNGQIQGLTVDVTNQSYTGKVIKFSVGNYVDGQKTSLRDIRIIGTSITTGQGIYMSASSSSQVVSFVSVSNVRFIGLQYGIHLFATGNGWVNGNHFTDIQMSFPVTGIYFDSDGGQVNGNVFAGCSFEKGSSTTEGIKMASTGAANSNIYWNQFYGDIWDTTTPINVTASTSIGKDNLFQGRFDGTWTDNGQNIFVDLVSKKATWPNGIFTARDITFQPVNGDNTIFAKRATDSGPSGNFVLFQTAAGGNLYYVGVDGTANAIAFQGGTSTHASTGMFRLASAEAVNFRNNANSGDITGLAKDTNDVVQVGSAGMKVVGATPTVSASQVGFGTTTATTATAGAQTLPANPAGFLVINIGGTTQKIPYYNS